MGHVPASGFAGGLAQAVREVVVGMDLHREFFGGKWKLQEQWKTRGIGCWTSNEWAAGSRYLNSESVLPFKRTVLRLFAKVSGEPSSADLLLER